MQRWGEKRFFSFDYYCKLHYGKKMYKLTLPGGTTCPNRDGTIGDKGCIFCSEGGSGDFCPDDKLALADQFEAAKFKIASKLPSADYGFLAYFQSFTSTYLPIASLREKLEFAASQPDIGGICIATRPDCLGEDVLTLLCDINRLKPVTIELGLQTIHEDTARYIRRGYPLTVFENACIALARLQIPVVVHVILGLPGENISKVRETICYLNRLNCTKDVSGYIHGIKLQLLHILKGTDLCKEYESGKFESLTFEEYVDMVITCLECLSPDISVQRLTGDGPKSILVAPLWSGDKKRVLNTINSEMKKRDTFQGRLFTE